MKTILLKTSLALLMNGFFVPVLNANDVEETNEPKKELPGHEVKSILENLRWSIQAPHFTPSFNTDSTDYIIEKSKTYFIPEEITRRLMQISHLHNDKGGWSRAGLETDQEIRAVLEKAGVLELMSEKEVSIYIEFAKELGPVFFESERSKTIDTLSEIGKSQLLPSDVVSFLQESVFEISNVNVRPHAVSAIGNIAKFHPPNLTWLNRWTEMMRYAREKNQEIKELHKKYNAFLEESLGFPGSHFDLVRKKMKEESKTAEEALNEVRENRPPPFLIGYTEYIVIYEALGKIAQEVFFPSGVGSGAE